MAEVGGKSRSMSPFGFVRLAWAPTATLMPDGMTDYQIDQVEAPQLHPAAVSRLTGQPTTAYRLIHRASSLPPGAGRHR
jgi:hypothetical protein